MTGWTRDELAKIGTAQELQIASLRRDGSLRNPSAWATTSMSDPIHGRAGGWFPGTQVRHQGHIRAGGVDKDITFADADPTSTTRSTPPTATSTAAMGQAPWAAS